jgi:hypothetical protein
MQSESRQLPAETVAASAQAMAGRWMWIALVPAIVTALFALTMIGAQFSSHHLEHKHTVGGVIFAGVVFVGLPGSLVIWFLARARHYAGLAKIAAAEKALTWHLAGKSIAATLDGVPQPELVFSITRAQRRSLTAVPVARLVQ